MAEILSCPACRQKVQIPPEYLHKTVRCPACKETFEAIPVEVGVQTSPTPARRSFQQDDLDDNEPHRPLAPHRGGMILAFGIMAITFCGIIFGPLAWVMGGNDLREMEEGRMERSGQGITSAGRVLGMIATWMILFQVLTCIAIPILFFID